MKAIIRIFFVALILMLASCKVKERVVEVPVVHTEYVNHRDTVAMLDSIYVWHSDTIRMQGDSVFVTRWRVRDHWRDVYKQRIDTVMCTDTITLSYPIAADYTFYDRLRFRLFWPLVLLVVALGIHLIIYIRKR